MSDYQGNIVIKNPATPTGPSAYGRAPGMWKLNEVAYWIKQGVWPNPAITPDTYFPYTSLLLSTTSLGNANNNLFVDSSGAFNPVSRNGNTTQGSFTPYSTNWSNYFDGNASTSISVSDASAFDFGTGDFTIECWAFVTAQAGSFSMIAATTGVNQYWGFGSVGSGGMTMFGGGVDIYSGSGSTPAFNTWNHLVWQRSGGIASMYLNGVRVYNASYTADFGSSATGFKVGRSDSYNNYYTTGYISNMRVVKGTGVYSGATITVPTSPLTAISGTSLLTCQSNRFRDASSGNLTVTASGNVAVQDFSPFSPAYPGAVYNQSDITNWSGYFDGSGDYLSSTATALGSGAFTVECWFYATTTMNYGTLWSTDDGTNSASGIRLVTGPSDNTLVVGIGGSAVLTSSSSFVLNAWNHAALVRSGTTITVYLNGVSVGTLTNSTNFSLTNMIIGRYGNAYYWNGYLSNLRAVVGAAVYTGNFTPPTTNLTAISGTSLLTLQNAAFTDNSTNNFVITPFGNTTVTGNSPFNTVGYWSNYFDASGDYQRISSSQVALQFGTGDFTIEGWAYSTGATGTYQQILTGGSSWTSGSGGVYWYYNGGSPYIGAAWNQIATNPAVNSGTLATNTWHHFAVVRSGNTLTLYINGSSVDTLDVTGVSMAVNNQSQTNIGGGGWDQDFGGYLSNLRVVKGTAVYTSNFTVPTTPLTAITNTSLLVCQAARFIDSSSNAFTLVPAGNVAVQSFDPFYTSTMASNGGSMYFSSTSTGSLETILTVPASNTLDIGAGDFTLECWAYATSVQNYSRVVNFNNTWASAGAANLLFATDTQKITFASYDLGGTIVNADSTYVLNTWYHIAVTRASNVFSLYINGVKQAATYSSSSRLWATTTPTVYIGNGPTSVGGYSPFQGYITDTRIIKGSAIYTASFTPPTAPLTPTPSTVLLVNGMNAGIYDATTINDMTTVGNAQVRYPSPFAPADYYAGSFDGAGDYLTVPYSTALQLPGDFTIEAWVYLNSRVTSFPCIVANYSTYAANGGFALFAGHNFNTTKYTVSFNGSFPVLTSSSSIVYGVWTHVAVVRSGSTLTLYINGVSEATATNSATVTGTGDNWWIATSGDSTTSSYINGSISNLRVVKGTAVYTSNFTPSTTPLTAISGTSLLTCQNKTFIDNSTNAIAITSYGNATAGAISPFAGTGGTSVYFDGSGDYLVTYRALNLRMGAGNITAECWIYPTSKTGWRGIFCKGNNSSQFEYSLGWEDSVLTARLADNGSFTVTDTVTLNAWNHIAYVRNGTNFTVYINGTAQGTATSSTSFVSTQNNEPFLVGYYNFIGNDAWFQGYIDDLRVTKGVARYTANFTPPTQAFPTY